MEIYNPFSLDGKRILVTGASSGIGREVAIRCSQLGANVIATGRNEERLKKTYSLLQPTGNHKIITTNLDDETGIDILVQNIESVEGVVFCAGINDKYILKAIDKSKAERIFNINVFSPILTTKELLKKKKISKGASLVLLSSISSTYATISNTLYAASKGAINSITRVWALELSSKKIRVNSILPGMVKTGMIDSYGLSEEGLNETIKSYPLGRLGETEDIANAVIYFLSDASSWVTGSSLVIDGGLSLR